MPYLDCSGQGISGGRRFNVGNVGKRVGSHGVKNSVVRTRAVGYVNSMNLKLLFALGTTLLLSGLAYPQRNLTPSYNQRVQESAEMAGTWKWFNGSTVLAMPDGLLRSFARNGNQGSGRYERLADGRYRLVWGDDVWVDILELKSGGNVLEGVNQKGTKVSAVKLSSSIDEDLKNLPPYSLSGTWIGQNAPEGPRYYVNQVGKSVYWYGESQTEGPQWAHVVIGTIQDGKLVAHYADIPKGKNRNTGELKFEIVKPDELFLYASTGGWPSKVTYVRADGRNSSGEPVIRRKVVPVPPAPGATSAKNPFGVKDVGPINYEEIRRFAAGVSLPASPTDANAETWAASGKPGEAFTSLEGVWSSRWSGGVSGTGWTEGTAQVKKSGDDFFILYEDKGKYLVEGKMEKDLFLGKYVNLNNEQDTGLWVGKVVGNDRIDGQWARGRWDFRR